jgi:transcriptional regulator
MHPNPVYRDVTRDDCMGLARSRGFGQLTIAGGADGPLAAHVPFVIAPDGTFLELHLMRSNPVARALATPCRALLAVTGPDGYVSPDWYGLPDQVPTWNYIAVHLRGPVTALPSEALRGVLDRLSDEMEGRLPKTPWTSAKMTPGVMERMMRSLVACRMDIAHAEGTWKLSQNKPEAARLGAADRIGQSAVPGQERTALAALMRGTRP